MTAKATLKLYELSAEYLDALEALAELEDLPPEVIADTLEGLAGAWEDKALNVARYVRNLEAEAAAIEEARKRMDARAKATANQAARLKAYLKAELERTGLKPKAPDLALRLQSNPPSVVVDDETRIPNAYRRTETVTTLLKADISAALKAGKTVAGAHLEASKRLVIQ
ncbi:siphovirus Gp157 family protein [Allochromatium humboldtianum]|uniref:Siphovirus Gp157 family protein n=1 Tax=Allochromatium humboldtianum TaxID=504901 RepID=A0A850R7G1_9GAMM|nr:siphovirus Gp157 family protein [Allochromatium humboldtianum]NVZ09764.1 siphovirus Gp157 family protein [Allochromatium humboldtianum]